MITSEFEGEYVDDIYERFATYEDYLDNFIMDNDTKYLTNIELARQLIELGIHSKQQILKKEQFEAKLKAIAEAKKNQNNDKVKELSHNRIEKSLYQDDEFLRELALREEEVINGKLMVIIFIRAVKRKPKLGSELKKVKHVENKYDKNDIRYLKKQKHKEEEEQKKSGAKDNEELQLKELEEEGIEISGYIDFAHRLKTEDFAQYFSGQKMFLPKNTDLSYYNWNTGVCVSNDSPNFKVDASSGTKGLLFRNKRDRKVINVDPGQSSENVDNTTKRTVVKSKKSDYKQIVIFDHYTRRKT